MMKLLQYKKSVIAYKIFGSGEKLLFCFHGYGEDSSSFYFLENVLEKDYTFIAIDLPFHGATIWDEGLLLKRETLILIIQQIISSMQPYKPLTFSLLGYSMGGRVALHLLLTIPQQIDRVILIAPDGLHKNLWYWLATQTWTGNKLFRFAVKHPQLLFGLMTIANKLGIMNKSIFRFAHQYLDDEHARTMLYKRWTTMRKFKPSLPLIISVIKQYKIPMRLLFGSYDRVILSKRSNFLSGDEEADVQTQILEAGHQLLKVKHADDIAALFYY